MITIIHGDDIATSRNYLNEMRQRIGDVTLVDGEGLTVTDLTQIMDGGDLFQTKKTVIIERFYAKRKATKEFEAFVSVLQQQTLEHEIILWEPKELDKKALSFFKYATVKNYKLPQTLFLFLDNLKPQQGQKLVQLFHTVLDSTDSEMVFFMLVRQIRLLLALYDKSTEQIDEVKRLAPWQLGKMQKQARLFSKEELVSLHSQLYTLDTKLKTGQLNQPLSLAIDFFLLGI